MYRKILSVNLKHNFILPFLAGIGVFLLAFLLFGVTKLTEREAAQLLELVVCWVGPVLLTPVFLPEQDQGIRDVIRSKKVNYLKICAVRVGYSVAALTASISAFVAILWLGGSCVGGRLLFGAVATALFLGAVGFLAAGISDNAVVGYMVAMMYYLMNYGLREKLGVFYLFGMRGGEDDGKIWLFLGSCGLILAVFGIKARAWALDR